MKKYTSPCGLGKVALIALLTFNFFVGYAQDEQIKVVKLPQSKNDINSNVMISDVIFKEMMAGKIVCYTDNDCKKVMSVKELKKSFTDSVVVPVVDKNGEITGKRTVAKLYSPDSLTEFRLFTGKKTGAVLGYRLPVLSVDGELLGYRSVCYIKFADMDKVLTPFEKKSYNTHFREQLK